METAVGVVDVKSSPVYFHVQRNSTYTLNGTTIPFEIERLNIGGGMNINSGIFTAPKTGIYFFSTSKNILPDSNQQNFHQKPSLSQVRIGHTTLDLQDQCSAVEIWRLRSEMKVEFNFQSD